MLIGNIKTETNIFLAPMAGISDMAFRLICKEFGCGLVYTEMISAKGLHYKNDNTYKLMQIHQDEKPIAMQIFGNSPEIMAESAVQMKEAGADIIDINMGCPTPKIVNNGDGCALMKDVDLAGKIIESVVKAVTIPVTIKIRKGWDDESINAVDLAQIAEEKGAKAVTIHGRTRQQFYSGKADWDIIKKVKNAINIPVIGNGDIFVPETAKKIFKDTNCDGIMVGRGAHGNPWIFKRISTYLSTGEMLPKPIIEERINMVIRHMNKMIELKGEYNGIKEMRKHIIWYLKGLP
ncbi:MAG: tRNA dihydrouridine synthase DusB, partial [Firmicutes bacterium]|nr:tRNA dihydrouridine synthase DusB [Bacillota bacterium]